VKNSTSAKKKPARPATKGPARVAPRKRRSADDILNRILKAAATEFKRSGFTGTTTASIARKADVTEAQLFRYFGSKADLFRETIFKPLDEQLMKFAEQHMSGSGTSEDSLENAREYTTALQQFIREHSAMFTSLIVAQTYGAGAESGVGEIDSLRVYFDHAATLMTSRMKSPPKFDPRLMVRACFASVLACTMFRDWIFPRGLATDEEITAAVNNFVTHGLSARYTE
jgi:AcrR family transcriptional regulator